MFTPPRLAFPLLLVVTAAVHAGEVQKLPDLTVEESRLLDRTFRLNAPPVIDDSSALDDLARHTAGFSVSDAGARGFGQITSLRGLANTPFFGDSSAPVYLDDIPLASAFTFPTGLFDFTRAIVHRGPQAATVFGRAADAGVIQFVGARPTTGTQAHLSVAAGAYDARAVTASVLSALDAATDVTAAVGQSQRDGYIRNTQLHQTVDDRDSTSARIRLAHRFSGETEISLHLLGSRTRDGAQALVPLGGPLFSVQRGREGETDIDFAAAALGVAHDFAAGKFSATSSWSNWDLSPYSNRLVVFGGLDFDSAMTQSQRTFAEELHFVGDRWSAGAFWSTSRTRGATDRVFSGFPIERSSFTTDADSYAMFGRTDIALGRGWMLTPGLRAESASKDFTRFETIPNSSTIRRDETWSALLPSLGAVRTLTDDSDFSLTLARGFKPGGYSAFTGRADLAAFGPQRTWTAEAAYHAVRKQAHLDYTARIYASRVRGYQIERSFAVPNSFTDEYLVVNAREARVLGAELESVWTPAANWNVSLAASFCRATLRDFTDPFTGISYSGNQAPYAPAGNGSLRIDYRPAQGFFAGAGITWTGTTYYDEQETALFSQRSYALLEADAGYAFARGSVRLFGRNLGDKGYYSAITPGVAHATPGAPLTWGFELRMNW